MGTIRFLLAMSVVLWHLGDGFSTLINGYVAVISFYMISGFYMAMVINEKYGESITRFYAARAFRLLPLYWLVCLLTLAAAAAFPGRCVPTECAPPTAATAIANVAVLGLDVVALVKNLTGESFLRIVGQAWTLSIELQFYLLAPFIVRRPLRQLAAITIAAIASRLALSGADYSTWRYYFGPSVWCFFFLGALSSRVVAEFKMPRFAAPMCAGCIVLVAWLATLSATKDIDRPEFWAYYLIFAASLPAIFHRTRNLRWDDAIGNLSYPIYLVHPLVFTIVLAGVDRDAALIPVWVIAVVATLIVAALLSYGIEAPMNSIRRRFFARLDLALPRALRLRSSGAAAPP